MGQKQSQIYCNCAPNHIAVYKAHIELPGKLKRSEVDKQFGIWWGAEGWVLNNATKVNKNWDCVCYACHNCIANKRKAPVVEYYEQGFFGNHS